MTGTSDRTPRQITLRQIVACTRNQQEAVRVVRNQTGVRSSMYTEHLIALDEHLSWIEGLKNDKRQLVFAILNEVQTPIGVVSLNALDRLHKKSDWAFYLDENERGGLGAALEYQLIEFAFEQLGLEKLNCEVIETNEAVVRMHKKFFFAEEGFRRANIAKNGQRIGVFFLGLTKQDWLANKEQVQAKYEAVFSRFTISIEQP